MTRATTEVHPFFSEVPQFWVCLKPLPIWRKAKPPPDRKFHGLGVRNENSCKKFSYCLFFSDDCWVREPRHSGNKIAKKAKKKVYLYRIVRLYLDHSIHIFLLSCGSGRFLLSRRGIGRFFPSCRSSTFLLSRKCGRFFLSRRRSGRFFPSRCRSGRSILSRRSGRFLLSRRRIGRFITSRRKSGRPILSRRSGRFYVFGYAKSAAMESSRARAFGSFPVLLGTWAGAPRSSSSETSDPKPLLAAMCSGVSLSLSPLPTSDPFLSINVDKRGGVKI